MRMLVVPCLLMVLTACNVIIAPDNQGSINMIIGGDSPAVDSPDTFSVRGTGVYFRSCEFSSWQFIITVKNIGNTTIDSMDLTVLCTSASGQTETQDGIYKGWWSGFLPGEYKTIEGFNPWNMEGIADLQILSAKIDPASGGEIVLQSDPVITFRF